MRRFRNLYIHVPFCRRKCGYCAFYSLPETSPEILDAWLDAILRELADHAAELRNVRSVYIGGGTPSLLPPEMLARLLSGIRNAVRLEPGAEVTMEANPETVTPELCRAAASLVNRVSMGVQSFSPERLRAAGRHVPPPDAPERALAAWRDAGIGNCGIDLISGLPGQTLPDWENDLLRAVRLPVRHISAYALIVEENTPLARSGWRPDDPLAADMWFRTGQILAEHGFPRYEISNYAAEPFHARHNDNIWHGETYLGLGPSASSFDGTDRWTAVSDLRAWLRGAPPEYDRIPRDRRLREIFVMGLRTVRGWAPGEFLAATGTEPDFPELHFLREKKFIECGGAPDAVRPTETGLAFWNDLALELI